MAAPPPNQERIAHLFLKALGAPDTPAMRRAVIAWLRMEGISSVKRNNPWNLHGGAACGNKAGDYCPGGVSLPGAVGRYNAGPGDKNVVVFATLESGVTANANNLIRLRNSGYGYDRVIDAARAGNPVAFLDALARSSWSAGRYRIDPKKAPGGSNNKLIRIYQGLGGSIGNITFDRTPPDASPPSGGGTPSVPHLPPDARDAAYPRNFLGGWGNHVKFEEGHILNAADVDTIMGILKARGFFEGDVLGIAEGTTRKILLKHVGQPWNKKTQESIQGRAYASAEESAALGGFRPAVDFLGALTDPGHWAYFLALFAGGVLTLVGGYMTLRAVSER